MKIALTKELWMALFLFSMVFPMVCIGQGKTLWFINGKKISIQEFHLIDEDAENPIILFTKMNGRIKDVYKDEVYSVIINDTLETVFYEPGIDDENILSQPQMKHYIQGLHDAKNLQISPLYTLGGFTAGMAGALVPQPEFKISDSRVSMPVGMIIPVGYVGLSGVLAPSAEALKMKTDNQLINEYYLMGLHEGTKKKVVRQSILGAGLGFIAGVLILFSAR